MTDTGPSERAVLEIGLIADEDLPEDLRPEQTPLARDPEDARSGRGYSRTSRPSTVGSTGERAAM